MAVRAGAPNPDISSLDALKRTLLQAKSIAYSASVSGIYVSTELFQRLGIANQMPREESKNRARASRRRCCAWRGRNRLPSDQRAPARAGHRLRRTAATRGSESNGVFGRRRGRFEECGRCARAHQISGVTGSSQHRCQEWLGADDGSSLKELRARRSRVPRSCSMFPFEVAPRSVCASFSKKTNGVLNSPPTSNSERGTGTWNRFEVRSLQSRRPVQDKVDRGRVGQNRGRDVEQKTIPPGCHIEHRRRRIE